MTTLQRFDSKDPGETIPLLYDFTAGLATGEILTGTPTVTISVVLGTDASPNAVLVGGNIIDSTQKRVLVPVHAGLDACDYDIVVTCATNNASKILVLGCILPVRVQ